MKAKQFRQNAWKSLHGQWGTMASACFFFILIQVTCAALSFFYIGGFAALFLTGALTLGFAQMALTAARTEKVRFGQLFDGFKNYESSLALYILILIFTFLWTLLLIIPGIIKSYSYSMSYFILADHPQMPANQARKYSIELMKGNKWRLFCLDFSFIGWILLSILTLGILSFWIVPYRETARAEFYRYLVSEDEKNVNTAPEVSK